MNCEEIKSKSIAYLQKDIDETIKQKILAHLQECEACKNYYYFVEQQFNQLPQATIGKIDPYFFNRLMAKIETQPTQIPLHLSQRILRIAAVAAMVIFSIIGGAYVGNYSAQSYFSSETTFEAQDVVNIDLVENSFDILNQ
jgi:predicted anti-sigma-YlaC factor YlaD